MHSGAPLRDGPLTEEHKADFTEIYTQPDPRAYYRTLGSLDYQIPRLALPVFEAALEDHPRPVLDICCSYGVNAALLRCAGGPKGDPLRVERRYSDGHLDALSAAELIAADRAFYSGRGRELTLYGLDSSPPAIRYATNVGLLDGGWAENLEDDDPSPSLAAALGEVGMVVSTGGFGYVGLPTFERVVAAVDDPADLRLVIFVLRVFDYTPVIDMLSEHGLVTERLPAPFRQRRFVDSEERDAAIEDVQRLGLSADGLESEGWFYADCYVTRPPAEAELMPVSQLWSRAAARV